MKVFTIIVPIPGTIYDKFEVEAETYEEALDLLQTNDPFEYFVEQADTELDWFHDYEFEFAELEKEEEL